MKNRTLPRLACPPILLLLLVLGSAFADPITLQWDRNPEPDIKEYRVYSSDEKGVYGAPTQVIKGDAATPTEATLDLAPDVLHFAVVTAFSTAGLESMPSEEIAFRIGTTPPSKPGNLRVKIILNATLQISRDLEQWVDRGSVASDQLFFRLASVTPGAEAGAGNPAKAETPKAETLKTEN